MKVNKATILAPLYMIWLQGRSRPALAYAIADPKRTPLEVTYNATDCCRVSLYYIRGPGGESMGMPCWMLPGHLTTSGGVV